MNHFYIMSEDGIWMTGNMFCFLKEAFVYQTCLYFILVMTCIFLASEHRKPTPYIQVVTWIVNKYVRHSGYRKAEPQKVRFVKIQIDFDVANLILK